MSSRTVKLLQQVKDDYNKIAVHFSQTRVCPWVEFELFKEYIKPGQKILDLGCGNGRFYKFLMEQKLEVDYYGLDNSEEFIRIAKGLYPEIADKFILSEMTDLKFPEGSFDSIVLVASFQHLPSKKLRLECLAECQRVLKPGGYLLMTNWYLWKLANFKNYFNHFWQKASLKDFFIPWKDFAGTILSQRYYHAFTEGELNKLLSCTNFRMENNFLQPRQEKSGKAKNINLVTIAKKK